MLLRVSDSDVVLCVRVVGEVMGEYGCLLRDSACSMLSGTPLSVTTNLGLLEEGGKEGRGVRGGGRE